jgi:hypothetical protein
MAIIHKCDACKKSITGERTNVDVGNFAHRVELCGKCAAPIHTALKKMKLMQNV